MSIEIETFVQDGVGVILLNRPKAINALNPDMMTAIYQVLEGWRDDRGVRLILFKGAGSRGFCAGGDVRWTREAILCGRGEVADGFFALEYSVNEMIATYEKPVVALTHGAVMGGGIGLAGHARYRFAHEGARFAMPESAIGFFCDIGAQSLLAQVSRARALLFMLSGNSVGVADAVALNLADCAVGEAYFEGFTQKIFACAAEPDIEKALDLLVQENGSQAGEAVFCQLADTHENCLQSDDLGIIMDDLERAAIGDPALGKMVQTLQGRCPTSNWVHVLARDAAMSNPDIGAVLASDLALAKLMARRPDFCEGVRAVLVDKDQNPHWRPEFIAQVERNEIARILGR